MAKCGRAKAASGSDPRVNARHAGIALIATAIVVTAMELAILVLQGPVLLVFGDLLPPAAVALAGYALLRPMSLTRRALVAAALLLLALPAIVLALDALAISAAFGTSPVTLPIMLWIGVQLLTVAFAIAYVVRPTRGIALATGASIGGFALALAWDAYIAFTQAAQTRSVFDAVSSIEVVLFVAALGILGWHTWAPENAGH